MRTYRVVISICSTDKGPPETTEVTHNVSANSIADLVAYAGSVISTFGNKNAIAEHDLLVAAQNKEPADAGGDSK